MLLNQYQVVKGDIVTFEEMGECVIQELLFKIVPSFNKVVWTEKRPPNHWHPEVFKTDKGYVSCSPYSQVIVKR